MQTKRKICAWLVSSVLLTWACGTQGAQKPKDADCLACHSDATLTKDVNGEKVSLYVDPIKMKSSIHGTMFSCVDGNVGDGSAAEDASPPGDSVR